MTIKKIFRVDKGTLKRSLKTLDVFAIGYGDLGSSIYYALGITALYALGATPIALVVAGLVFFLTALTYAEMSSVIHESGGSASFSRKSLNDLVAFIAGWALLLDYIVTIAISTFAVGPYLKFFIPSLASSDTHLLFTVGIILFLFLLNLIGTKHSTRFSSILTIATILTQFVIILFGFFTIFHFYEFFKSLVINSKISPFSPTWGMFFKGVAMAMVAYTGIESMAQLSAETKTPSKTVPKAMMIAVAVLLISYLGLSTIALSVMTPDILSTTYIQDPVSGIALKLPMIGPWMSGWIGILGAVILLAAANSGMLGASRVAFNLGEYCQLPKFFYIIHPKFRTPVVSLAVFASLSILIILWSRGSLLFLADLYNFGAQLSFLSSHVALIMHRIQFPEMRRPFKLGFNLRIKGKEIPISAILGGLCNLVIWLIVVVTKKEGRELGLAWVFVGLIFYVFLRRHYKIGIAQSVEIKNIKIEDFEKLKMKKILVPIRKGHEEEIMKVACMTAKEMHAHLTVLYVSEIAYAIPLNIAIKRKSKVVESIFEKAEAIAKEYSIHIDCKQILSRSIVKTIVEVADDGEYDLIILGSDPYEGMNRGFNSIADAIIKESKCKVWVCKKENS